MSKQVQHRALVIAHTQRNLDRASHPITTHDIIILRLRYNINDISMKSHTHIYIGNSCHQHSIKSRLIHLITSSIHLTSLHTLECQHTDLEWLGSSIMQHRSLYHLILTNTSGYGNILHNTIPSLFIQQSYLHIPQHIQQSILSDIDQYTCIPSVLIQLCFDYIGWDRSLCHLTLSHTLLSSPIILESLYTQFQSLYHDGVLQLERIDTIDNKDVGLRSRQIWKKLQTAQWKEEQKQQQQQTQTQATPE